MQKVNFKELGNEAPSQNFTGLVHVNMVLGGGVEDLNVAMGVVNFENGARTNWHTHTTGQILFVTSGIGLYQERGKRIEELKEGEMIKIPKDVEHWHGASLESGMTHIAFVPNTDNGEDGKTTWLEAVSGEDYESKTEPQF